MHVVALRILIAASILAVTPLRHANATPRIDTMLVRDQLADGVYLFRAPSDLDRWTATNVVVVINDDDVTVFDSNARPRTTRKVIAEIRKLTNKPVRILVNSHWHLDHWTGNDEYVKAFPGLRIVATTQTRDFMRSTTAQFFADGPATNAARARARLDTAIRTGVRVNGTPLTPAARDSMQASLAEAEAFANELRTTPRVLPNMVFTDTMVFWSGRREFRLISATGDATGSAVLYLPAERILVMGDVLVRPEEGDGPPAWTTNSYAIRPWLNSLRALSLLDANIVVPGQGAASRDKTYLTTTAEFFAAIIAQVRAATERGIVSNADVQNAVDVSAFYKRYVPNGSEPSTNFRNLVASLVRKAHQEVLDGVVK